MIEMQYGLPPIEEQHQTIYLYPLTTKDTIKTDIGTIDITYNHQEKTLHINRASYLSTNDQIIKLAYPNKKYQDINILIQDIIQIYHAYEPNFSGKIDIHHYLHYAEWAITTIEFSHKNNQTSIEYHHKHTPKNLIATRKPIKNIADISHLPTLYKAFYALQTDNLPLFDPTYEYQQDYIKHKKSYEENTQNCIYTTLGVDPKANNIKIFTLHIDVETYQRRINLPMPNSDQNIQYIIQQLNAHTQKIITEYTNAPHISQHQIIHIIRTLQHSIDSRHHAYIQTMQNMHQQYHQHYI